MVWGRDLSVPGPGPHCFDYCHFEVNFETCYCESSAFALLSQACAGQHGSFVFLAGLTLIGFWVWVSDMVCQSCWFPYPSAFPPHWLSCPDSVYLGPGMGSARCGSIRDTRLVLLPPCLLLFSPALCIPSLLNRVSVSHHALLLWRLICFSPFSLQWPWSSSRVQLFVIVTSKQWRFMPSKILYFMESVTFVNYGMYHHFMYTKKNANWSLRQFFSYIDCRIHPDFRGAQLEKIQPWSSLHWELILPSLSFFPIVISVSLTVNFH